MGLSWLPVVAFWRHPSDSSFDCVPCSECGPQKGWAHRAEARLLACTFVLFRLSPSRSVVEL